MRVRLSPRAQDDLRSAVGYLLEVGALAILLTVGKIVTILRERAQFNTEDNASTGAQVRFPRSQVATDSGGAVAGSGAKDMQVASSSAFLAP